MSARTYEHDSTGVGAFTYHYEGVTDILTRLDLPNGTQTVQSYDGLQRLTQVVNQKNSGATLNAFSYAYDNRDVRTGVQQQYGADPLRQVNYTYDSVDQLKGETATGGAANTSYSNAFSYDDMGNRLGRETTQGSNSSSTKSSVNALNQLTSLSSSLNGAPRVTSGLTYDVAGNTTSIANSDGTKTLFAYDDADRLTRIETRNAADAPLSKSEFVYDYASRKAVSREFTYSNGAWQQTDEKRRVFDGLDVVQERNAANEVTAQLVRDGNIGGILARSTAAGASFFGYDGGGNVTLLTDENGDDVGRYRYDAFGNTLEASGVRAAENPYRFSTKELHAASGLYDFGFRFYSASLGRWINRDPIAEGGGVNLYGFASNSPANLVDFYGLSVYVRLQGNNVLLILPIEFHAAAGEKEDADFRRRVRDYSRNIEKLWTGKFGKYNVTTKVVSKSFTITRLEGTQKLSRLVKNEVWLTSKNGQSSCTPGMLNTNLGFWYNEPRWRTAPHEAGHLMGLRDRYRTDKSAPDYGAPFIGWATNIMANSDSGKAEERSITEILQANVNTTDIFIKMPKK